LEQYFTNNPNLKSELRTIIYKHEGETLTFYSDNGVFSKDKLDFGSNLLLDTLFKNINNNDNLNILDVGCGYGPIGLMIAKVSPHHEITMVDVNQRALALSAKNGKLNHIENVEIKESDGLSKVEDNAFDAILTNPPIRAGKKVVHSILEDSFKKLK